METDVISEIRECLPRGRTLFRYFKDRYALMLLSYIAAHMRRVGDVKRSRFAPLLMKPTVRDALARSGSGVLVASDLAAHWPRGVEHFVLTVDQWGCDGELRQANDAWWQTSRPGWNLVLQLNFSTAYDDTLTEVLEAAPTEISVNTHAHPVRIRGRDAFFRETLAWARIDLDFETNEALIEEVQSDWARWMDAAVRCWLRAQLQRLGEAPAATRRACIVRAENYISAVLPRYRAIWQEAMLAAAIAFIRDELGLRTIYYHTYESGLTAKQLTVDGGPPRSLYTDLPRRFCFEKTPVGPEFLHRDPRLAQRGRHRNDRRLGTRRERLAKLWWHRLAV